MSGLKLHGEVSLDGSGWEKGLHKIQHSSTHVFKEMAATAFGLYGIEQAIHRTIERGEELVNASKRMDSTVEQLQLIRQGAKEAGTELGSVAGVIEKINIARQKIQRGDKDAPKLLADFKALGVTPAMLKNQTGAGLLLGPISKTARSRNVADISLQLREILGKGFGDVLPLLKTDMEELESEMKKLGIIMDTETAVKLKMIGSELSMLSQIIVVQLGPVLVSLTRTVMECIGGLKVLASFAGGISYKATAGDLLKAIAASPADLVRKLFSKDALKEGLKNAAGTGEQWKGMLDAMDEKMKEEAEKLKHGSGPMNGTETGLGTTKHGKALRAGDSLVAVGNFLGSAGTPAGGNPAAQIVRIQEKHLAVSQRTLLAIEKMSVKIGLLAAAGVFPP